MPACSYFLPHLSIHWSGLAKASLWQGLKASRGPVDLTGERFSDVSFLSKVLLGILCGRYVFEGSHKLSVLWLRQTMVCQEDMSQSWTAALATCGFLSYFLQITQITPCPFCPNPGNLLLVQPACLALMKRKTCFPWAGGGGEIHTRAKWRGMERGAHA